MPLALFCFLLVVNIACASAAGVDTFSFPVGPGYELTLNREEYQARLDVREKGKLTQFFSAMGNEFRKLRGGKRWATGKAGADTVLLLHTEFPPFVGAAWVFRHEKKENQLGLITSGEHGRYLPVPLNAELELSSQGEVIVRTPGGGGDFRMRWNGRGWDRR